MRLLIVLAVSILVGCAAGPTWYKAGATQASFDSDKEACQYEAIKHGGSFDPSFGKSYATAMHRNEIVIACLRQKGYTTDPSKIVTNDQSKYLPVEIMVGGKPARIN